MTRLTTAFDETLERINALELEDEEVIRAREVEAERFKRRQKAIDLWLGDVGQHHRAARVSNYKVYDRRQKQLVEMARKLGEQISDVVLTGMGLFLYGPPGTGKDHIAIALLKHAATQGYIVRWIDGQTLYRDVYETGGHLERQLYSPDIVCLSDPVLESTTDANRKCLFRVVNTRYIRCKCTWITCNLPSVDGKDAATRAAELFGEQTFSRLRSNCESMYCGWDDYRTMQGAEK